MFHIAGLIAGLTVSAPVAAAPTQIPPAQLEAGLAGNWTGALQYRDYQTDKLTLLPLKQEIRALPDGATIIAIANFDDGPKTGAVIITTVSLFRPKTGSVETASFRRGDDTALETQRVDSSAVVDGDHWTLTYLKNGKDNDMPAEIRVTETRSGDRLVSVEEYRPIGGAPTDWKFRNRTDLTRSEK